MTGQSVLAAAKERSDKDLARLRELTLAVVGKSDLIVGVNGSYARREATTGSDLDLFFLFKGDAGEAIAAKDELAMVLGESGFKPPSQGGVFEKPLSVIDLTENIGGAFDTNETITRRMLLLLEGEWLANKDAFDDARATILKAYVPDEVRADQISLFLLNDIIVGLYELARHFP